MKIIIFFLIAAGISPAATGQCTQIKPQEMRVTCKTLQYIVETDISNENYDKVLLIYLLYNHLNEICTPPQTFKDFMNDLRKQSGSRFEGLTLRLAGSSKATNPDNGKPAVFHSAFPTVRSADN